jgi:predicted nucleotidyltransferase
MLKEHRPDLERMGVKSLTLFGSAVRGEAREGGDVDLLVEFHRPVGLFEFIDVKGYLEGLLGCRVDLGTSASLRLQLRDAVLREAVYVPLHVGPREGIPPESQVVLAPTSPNM